MAIIEPVNGEEDLWQGDLLKDIPLFATEECDPPKPIRVQSVLCVVMSRPCNAVRDGTVVVAHVERARGNIPDADTLKKVKGFLESQRDGGGGRDRFYLGEVSGYEGRQIAYLEALYTVMIPKDTKARAAFLARHRIGRLSADFARDLHMRLFCAYASLGFADFAWYSDGDLDWVIKVGEAEQATASAELKLAEADAMKVAGFSTNPAKDRQSEARKKLLDIEARLEPFLRERAIRANSGARPGQP